MSSLGLWLPFLVIIGIWIFLMNRMQGGGRGGAMGFGKSKAKLLTEKHGKVTFNGLVYAMNWEDYQSTRYVYDLSLIHI